MNVPTGTLPGHSKFFFSATGRSRTASKSSRSTGNSASFSSCLHGTRKGGTGCSLAPLTNLARVKVISLFSSSK